MSKRGGHPDDDDNGGGKPKALTAQEKEDFDMALELQKIEEDKRIHVPVSSFVGAAGAAGASASICMHTLSSSASAHHRDDIIPPRGLDLPNVVNGAPVWEHVATIPFARASVGNESITSQLWRISAAEENVLKKRYPPKLIHEYPIHFTCDQVNEDDVRKTTAYAALLEALENGLPELKIPSIDGEKFLVAILVVNLERFGRTEAQLHDVMDDLKKAANGRFDVDILALDCFGLTQESIPVLGGYYGKKKLIDDEFGPHDDPGKPVPASRETKKERKYVKSNVPIIKKRLKRGDDELKQMIENGIKKSANLENTIFTQGSRAKFESKFISIVEEIKESDLEDEAMKSFIATKVEELAQLVAKYTGQQFTAMLFRRSRCTKSILAFDSVPAEQFAYGYADLVFLGNVPKTGELGIYFDDQRNRDQVTNPQYILYLATVLSGAIHTAVITEPNRIDRSRWLVELHKQACALRKTTIIFSKSIGKCVERIAYNEEMGKKAREEATLERNQTIDGFREKLPKKASPNEGFLVTRDLSKAMEIVGSSHLNNEELGK